MYTYMEQHIDVFLSLLNKSIFSLKLNGRYNYIRNICMSETYITKVREIKVYFSHVISIEVGN